jgi:hypothetical protein
MCMQPGILLMGCLLSLYLMAMLIFWHCLRGHKRVEPLGTEGRLTLRAGQTILGVMDTTEMMCFCIGKMEEHVHQEEDAGQ